MWSIWLAMWMWGAELEAQAPPASTSAEKEERRKARRAAAEEKRRKSGQRMRSKRGGKAKAGSKAAVRTPLAAKKAQLNGLARRRRYRTVISQASAALAKNPGDPDLHALRGVALAEYGAYNDAWLDLEMAVGADLVPTLTLAAQADTLRFTGDPRGALEARRVLVTNDASPQRELVMLTRIFEDHQLAGDLEGMWAVVHEAEALNPGSGVPYALMGLAHAVEGDGEAAEAALWVAEHREPKSIVYAFARVEVHRMLGNLEVAAELSEERRALVLRSKPFTAARGRALVDAGRFDEALELVDVQAWRLGEELWHPELLAVQALTYAGLGWHDAATEVTDRLARAYPAVPHVRSAIAAVEAQRPRD